MRYFKIVLACFGFIFTVVGVTAGVMFLTGKFDKEVVQPNDIAFDITEKLTEDDFEVVLSTTTENVTEKDVTLSLTNQTEKDGYISDGIITVPKVVQLGTPFVVQVNKTTYEGMDEEWNVGGTSVLHAKSTNPLIQEATPLTIEVDVPVHSLSVDLVTTTGTKIGTVAAKDVKGLLTTLSNQSDDEIVELAIGSVVRLQPVFTPAKSSKTTKGQDRKVLFEIPNAWRGIHIDFVDGENDLIEVLRQTTVEEIKVNAYCFRTSADEYAAQSAGYSDDELITMMNANGIKGESHQIFGTNQKITAFTSSTNDEYINLAINSPMTLIASGTAEGAIDLGLALASDAGVARLEDKIAVIKLYAYWQDIDGNWVDAGDKLMIVGQTSSTKGNGVKAKINKNDANLSSWKVIASETGTYKLVAKLSYEYFSSSSSTPTVINFEVEYQNVVVSDPISSDVNWMNTLPAIKQLVVLDGEKPEDVFHPTLNLSDYVEIKNPNATYKAVRFFAYSTEGLNLKNVIGCTLYDGNFDVPDSSETYEVFEIPNGILTAKDVGSFRIFFATVVSDYLGNPRMKNGQYVFESFSNTNTINIVKSLKSLDASMTVNGIDEGKEYNKNTDENTKDHIFHVRQQDENVFTLSLYVSDVNIFERDFEDGKIHVDFLLGGEKSNILTLSDSYEIDTENKRIDFLVSVKSLPDNNQPTLECKITYDLDSRLNKFVANNGNKVQIKVLNGFAQSIYFDAVKDADPKNSAENPIQVNIKFNAGTDNKATSIEYAITFNGENFALSDLSKVTINEEALNKTYSLSSNKPSVIAVEETLEEGAKLSILGSTEDEDVVVTATAADGSGLSASLYFKVLASHQITLTPNSSEIEVDGYQGNSINFKTYFSAMAGEIDLNNLLKFNVPISENDRTKFSFNEDDGTLTILNTLGRDVSLQLYITSDFGFTKIIPIRIVSCLNVSTNYAFNDSGLDDKDFVDRGETLPTERGTRVYAENTRKITFVLEQTKPSTSSITITNSDFTSSSGVSATYENGALTVRFDAVGQMTEKTITFTKTFSENDQYSFVYTMKFLVFPNIKVALTTENGTQDKPAEYKNGETVIYDVKNVSNGLITLERILGSDAISEHVILEAKLGGEWQALTSDGDGKFILPSSYRAVEGGYVEVRVSYNDYKLDPIQIFVDPYFDEETLLDASVLYGGQHYVPFVASGENEINLPATEGVTYTLSSEQYIRIRSNKIEKRDRLYTNIVISEKLRIENNNGVTELPIIILPVDYPFVVYDMIEDARDKETYRTIDLKNVIESQTIYDTIEAGEEEVIDLHDKIFVDGLDDAGAVITIANADGSTNNYINFDQTTLKLTANSVGKDKMIYVNVKCGAEFEEAFSFVYRLQITANQQIKVFYPYIAYNEEEYNVENEYEYLYFENKNQVSVDLLEEFDVNMTPNKALLDQLFETTDDSSYARRFVVVREKDDKFIPISYKDLHFEIASVGDGSRVFTKEEASTYATLTEKTSTSGVLESAQLFINKGSFVGKLYVTIRAYTTSGAEAIYKFQVLDEKSSFVVKYEDQQVVGDDFSVATSGQSSIDLNNNVSVWTTGSNQQPLNTDEYAFHLIVNEGVDTDYGQIITIQDGIIHISTLVNDVTTTVVVYNKKGEIARFDLVIKCTIDHEIKSTTIGQDGVFDISKNIEFFNASGSKNNYSMDEIETNLYVRDNLGDTVSDQSDKNNLFKYIGGYSIEDITKNYNQYVLLDNIKIYAENLVDIWGGKFYVDGDAKFEIKHDDAGNYIMYNGQPIYVTTDIVKIPLTISSDENYVEYKVKEDDSCVIIPHFSFTKGNDTRDYVLFDYVEYLDENKAPEYLPFNTVEQTEEKSHETYVYEYIDGKYVRYRVSKIKVEGCSVELKVSMLMISHNGNQYYAEVDKDQNDDEYISIDEVKHYFTRFYQITYSGLAEKNGSGNNNIPYVRYVVDTKDDGSVERDENNKITIDLSKILFFTQGDKNSILKIGGNEYKDDMLTFVFSSGELDDNDKTKLLVSDMSRISVEVKDSKGNFVIGRFFLEPTLETSSDSSTSNKTIVINAGNTDLIDYKISSNTISVDEYASAMDGSFTGKSTDFTTENGDESKPIHAGWSNYVYSVSSDKYKDESNNSTISIGENDGTISGLKDKEPWGDITVEAKLQYKSEGKTLTTTIPYEVWKKDFFDVTQTYDKLKAAMANQNVRIVVSDGIEGGNPVALDGNGNIINVAYDSTVTIKFQQLCENGIWVDFETEKHECYKTATGLTYDVISRWDPAYKVQLSKGEIVERGDTKYKLSDKSALTSEEKDGETIWTLDGSITSRTKITHEFTSSFVYYVDSSGQLPLTLVEEAKGEDEETTTYGKTFGEDDLTMVWQVLGFESCEQFIEKISYCSSSSGSVAYGDNSISITGATTQNVILSYVVDVPTEPKTYSIKKTIASINIGENYATLAAALDFTDDKILGYSSWDEVLADCDVEWSEYDEVNKTFGGTKTINLTLTTQAAAHTGTFYIVNKEIVETKAHRKGNLSKIDGIAETGDPETINTATIEGTEEGGEKTVLIATKVVGKFVLPMATKKYLTVSQNSTEGVETQAEGGNTTGVDKFKDLVKSFGIEDGMEVTYQLDKGDDKPTTSAIEGVSEFELSTAAELIGSQDPFNTIIILQNNYAIGKIHIYLEDYSGDNSYEKYNIYKYEFNQSDELTFTVTNDEGAELTFKVEEKTEEGVTTYNLTTTIKITIDDKDTTTYLTQNVPMTNGEYLFDNGLLVKYDSANKKIILKMISKEPEKTEEAKGVSEVSESETEESGSETEESGSDETEEDTASLEFEFEFTSRLDEREEKALKTTEKTYKFKLTFSKTNDSILQYNGDTESYGGYFEGLKDAVAQPTDCVLESGEKVYKAEKTGDDIIFREHIAGEEFNFDKWQYLTSYVDNSQQTREQEGAKVNIVNLGGDKKALTIIINNIIDGGRELEGYKFVVDLSETSVITINGMPGTTMVSPDKPIEGGSIASQQTKEITFMGKGDNCVFKDESAPATVTVDYSGNNGFKNTELSDDEKKEIVAALYKKYALSYLKAVLTNGSDNIESTTFRLTKSGSDISVSVVFVGTDKKEYVYPITQTGNDFSIGDTSLEGIFEIKLNTDLYSFSAKVVKKVSSSEEPKDEGEPQVQSDGELIEDEESGGDENVETPSTSEASEQLTITISPVFTYQYSIETNSSAVKVDVDKNFEQNGKLIITGEQVNEATVVKFKFVVLRGKGTAKEEAVAYYSLTVKPSFVADINYPSMKFVGDEKATVQEAEYFYAGASSNLNEFDVTKASELSLDEKGRIVVTKYAYGTATSGTGENTSSKPCEVIYETSGGSTKITKITINGKETELTSPEALKSNSDNIYTASNVKIGDDTYSISVYIPSLAIEYSATSTSKIILDKSNEQTTDVTNTTGEFTFRFDGVNIPEATVIISVQAVDDASESRITFGQYQVVVCKDPVISAIITTDPEHMDANGNEIIPIDGSTSHSLFTISDNSTTRVQFVYDNKILSGYNVDIWAKDTATIEIVEGKFSIAGTTYSINASNNCLSWDDGDTCTCSETCTCGKCAKIENDITTISIGEYNFELTFPKNYSIVSLTSIIKLDKVTVDPKTISSDVVTFTWNGQEVSGSYRYVTKWDYKLNPTGLSSHWIAGNYDPDDSNNLLKYYYLDAGKTYNIVDTFGIKKYFGGAFGEVGVEFVKTGSYSEEGDPEAGSVPKVKFSNDNQSIIVEGAPNGGMNFRIKITLYLGVTKTVGITISSTTSFTINYERQTGVDSQTYGLIQYSDNLKYDLVSNGVGKDFSVERNGVRTSITLAEFSFDVVSEETDDVNASVKFTADGNATLTAESPKLAKKCVVLKISDKYGRFEYLRYVLEAKTQIVPSDKAITFKTGSEIQWTDSMPFPIGFQKSGGDENPQLTSFYTATLAGAAETTEDGQIVSNVSDTYGAESSLRAENGKLYGVQFNNVITKKSNTTSELLGYEDEYYIYYYDDESDELTFESLSTYKETIEYTVTDSKVTIDGKEYTVTDGKVSIKYTVTDSKVKIDGKEYPVTDSKVKIGETEYPVTDGKVTIEYPVTDGKVTIDVTYSYDGVKNTLNYTKGEKAGSCAYKDGCFKTQAERSVRIVKNKHYVPYEIEEGSVPFDVYKTVAQNPKGEDVAVKGFNKYAKQIVYYGDGETFKKWDSTDPTNSQSFLGDDGACQYSEDNKFTMFVIELYETEKSEVPEGIVAFEMLAVTKGDKLYYQTRENASDGYTFKYSIEIDGTEYVGTDGKTIKEAGNGQFGSSSSLPATLKITVCDENGNAIDSVDFDITLTLGTTPYVTQKVGGTVNYDYVGVGDKIQNVLAAKVGQFQLKDSDGNVIKTEAGEILAPTYYTVLGNETSELNGSDVFEKHSPSEAVSGCIVEDGMLKLKATLSLNSATINNIKYTYNSNSDSQKLTIGYREVKLTNGEYVDEATGITYQVVSDDGTTFIYVCKALDANGEVTINNFDYKVENGSVSATESYGIIYLVWKHNELTYWAPWNYKVVDKYNKVTTTNTFAADSGTISIYLDWENTDKTWRFNANTLELINGENSYPVAQKATSSGSGYYVELDGTEYQIVINESSQMKFKNSSGAYYPVDGSALQLTEASTSNSSWADVITLTGQDESSEKLTNIETGEDKNVNISVGSGYSFSGKTLSISDDESLIGEAIGITITYKASSFEEESVLKLNNSVSDGISFYLSFKSFQA